ncbi:MAG: NAD(P)-dependent glycerol-3-phosphate dehydrogenase [Simkaniaceae bacterium]|nr:NAD(P)-dependent glycerol-3-phosphate dehydrogenase [Simkaniaceae bacterium]
MRVAYLGSGVWAYALANVLAQNGHDVVMWGIQREVLDHIEKEGEHPNFRGIRRHSGLRTTHKLEECLDGAELIMESVTSKGLRPVLKQLGKIPAPLVITSKGIEMDTGNLLPEIALDVLGYESRGLIGCLSGPSIAVEVLHKMPTSAVASAYDAEVMHTISSAFSNDYFRVYPNRDILGVAFGGAMKNIIAIASGICDGLEYGDNTKAAMITRGLHEIRKLSRVKGANPETTNGLSGLGDLIVTCLSDQSRNYRFGRLLADGLSPEEAKKHIGMVVEGANTCDSAVQLAEKNNVPLPITLAVQAVLNGKLQPKEAVKMLLTREIKEEYL